MTGHARDFQDATSPTVGYQAGGRVAAMHRTIETSMQGGIAALPEWTLHADALSPTDNVLQHLSRAIGVLALATGVTLTLAAMSHLF